MHMTTDILFMKIIYGAGYDAGHLEGRGDETSDFIEELEKILVESDDHDDSIKFVGELLIKQQQKKF